MVRGKIEGELRATKVPNRPAAVREKRPPLARWSGFTLELGTAAVLRGLARVATGHHSLQPPHDRTPEEGANVPGTPGSQEAPGLGTLSSCQNSMWRTRRYSSSVGLATKLRLHRKPLAHPRLAEHARRT